MKTSSIEKNYHNVTIFIVSLICDLSIFTDFSIDAPPSLKPAKKYSDISGLPVSCHVCKILNVQ